MKKSNHEARGVAGLLLFGDRRHAGMETVFVLVTDRYLRNDGVAQLQEHLFQVPSVNGKTAKWRGHIRCGTFPGKLAGFNHRSIIGGGGIFLTHLFAPALEIASGLKKQIRATAAKEAGQGMSTEETAVGPNQIKNRIRMADDAENAGKGTRKPAKIRHPEMHASGQCQSDYIKQQSSSASQPQDTIGTSAGS